MENEEQKVVEYMSVIYQHPFVKICDENNYKSIKATEDIPFGQLLLIEHVYASNHFNCHSIVEHNQILFDTYYPRRVSFDQSTDHFEQAKQKIINNCFGMSNGDKLLTYTITKINHSCTASCGVYIQEKYSMENTNIIFMELYSVKKILKNEELTINYGVASGHKRDFVCECGLDDEKRKAIFDITSSIVKTLSTDHHDDVREKVYQYLNTLHSKKILLNHYLSVNGLFVNQGQIKAYTESGMILVNKFIHKFLGISDDTNLEENSNARKLILFMEIMQNSLFQKHALKN